MILESLLELVETLKARIDAHGDQLRQSEALTRYALIDPLLRELGWDTEDPKLVRPEYPLRTEYTQSTRFADYALLEGTQDKPAMMVEAKSLGKPLRDQALLQGINYCQADGTRYFSVTDGQRWEVYETHKPVPIDEKRVVEFDIRSQETAVVCLKALALWRQSVQAGQAVAGQKSIFGPLEDTSVPPEKEATVDPPPPPPPPPPADSEPLTEITEATGRKVAEMVFPDGSRTPLRNWSFLPVEAVRWLMANGMLTAGECPIVHSGSRSSSYMVHTQPVHGDGRSFRSLSKVNEVYVERHGNSIHLLDRTRSIIEHAGQDSAQFSIRFS